MEKPAWYKTQQERLNPNVNYTVQNEVVNIGDHTKNWAAEFPPQEFLAMAVRDITYLYCHNLSVSCFRTIASHLWDQGVDLRQFTPTCEVNSTTQTLNLGTLLNWSVDVYDSPSRVFREVYDTLLARGLKHDWASDGPKLTIFDLSFQDHVRRLYNYLIETGLGYDGLSDDLNVLHTTMIRWDSTVYTKSGSNYKKHYVSGDCAPKIDSQDKCYSRHFYRQPYRLSKTVEVVMHRVGDPLNTLPKHLKECPGAETSEAIKRLAQTHRKFLADPGGGFKNSWWASL